MKFKIDENLPTEISRLLQDEGYDAMTVHDQQLAGEPDPLIASVCQEEERVIVTLDVGFADIRQYPPAEYFGIIVFRLKKQDKGSIINAFLPILPHLRSESLIHKLWIVDEKKIRVRD